MYEAVVFVASAEHAPELTEALLRCVGKMLASRHGTSRALGLAGATRLLAVRACMHCAPVTEAGASAAHSGAAAGRGAAGGRPGQSSAAASAHAPVLVHADAVQALSLAACHASGDSVEPLCRAALRVAAATPGPHPAPAVDSSVDADCTLRRGCLQQLVVLLERQAGNAALVVATSIVMAQLAPLSTAAAHTLLGAVAQVAPCRAYLSG